MLNNLVGSKYYGVDALVCRLEKTMDYDVLGVFDSYLNVIDRTGSDGREEMVKINRTYDGIVAVIGIE